jgi:hypothetical protein
VAVNGAEDPDADRARLRRLVRRFDTAEGEWAVRALTRAVVRAGRVLAEHEGFDADHPVRATIAAAEAYLAAPAEATYAAYLAAATRSYPFGGDARTLEEIASVVGARAVLAAIGV